MKANPTIVALGEILWDVFPDGPRFGGAPANFACSSASLSGKQWNVCIVSSVGKDELGRQALKALQSRGVNTTWVSEQNKNTGQVLVTLDDEGRATYDFANDSAWDNIEWNYGLQKLAEKTDALCFGTLGQRSPLSQQTLRRFITTTQPNTLRILDVNLRPPFVSDSTILESLKLANVLKLNDEEIPIIAELTGTSGSDNQIMQQLAEKFELQAVALTRGSDGALLVKGDEISDLAGIKTQVVDTVGAGDAFTATLALGLLENKNLEEINQRACKVAAYVCSQSGATPDIPQI